MTFGSSLYAVPLWVTKITYFSLETGNLEGGEPPEDEEVCCH